MSQPLPESCGTQGHPCTALLQVPTGPCEMLSPSMVMARKREKNRHANTCSATRCALLQMPLYVYVLGLLVGNLVLWCVFMCVYICVYVNINVYIFFVCWGCFFCWGRGEGTEGETSVHNGARTNLLLANSTQLLLSPGL